MLAQRLWRGGCALVFRGRWVNEHLSAYWNFVDAHEDRLALHSGKATRELGVAFPQSCRTFPALPARSASIPTKSLSALHFEELMHSFYIFLFPLWQLSWPLEQTPCFGRLKLEEFGSESEWML